MILPQNSRTGAPNTWLPAMRSGIFYAAEENAGIHKFFRNSPTIFSR
jgi:hypothetical protein